MRPRMPIVAILLLITAAAVVPSTAQEVTFQQVAKLTGSDTAGGDNFGFDVAIDGDRLIVGALWDDDLGPQSGAAYVFERDAGSPRRWREVAKLLAPDGLPDDWFGAAVAISGETAIIGASVDDATRNGYAYVFARDENGSWMPLAKLLAKDGAPDDSFGTPVEIYGNTVAMGASGADGPGGSYDGAVYIFERDAGGPGNWGQTDKLTAAKACDWRDPGGDGTGCGWTFDDAFGSSVALSSTALLVGGDLYVYAIRRLGEGPDSEWRRFTRIKPTETQNLDGIGQATAIGGGTLLLGAYGDDDLDGQAGAVHLYEADPRAPTGVRYTGKLYAADGGYGDYLGDSVALSGETAVVGAPQKEAGSRGFAYIFRRQEGSAGTWSAVTELLPAELEGGDRFGDAVAISGGTAVVGAWGDDDRGTQAGAVYVFQEVGVDPPEITEEPPQ